MNLWALFKADMSCVNVWASLTYGLLAFFGGFMGVKFAIWMNKE